MNKQHFHKNFKLQGSSFKNVEELLEFSESISVEVYDFLCNWFNSKKYVQVKTSGSTGTPKLIKLQKEFMINSALATGTYFNLGEYTSALLCMSVNYIAGKMMLVRALTLGWELDVVAPSSNPLKGNKVYDFCAMVPLQLNNSLVEINTIKKLIVGGGVVSNELLSKIQNVETEIFATYGMTETITHIAVKKLNNLKNVIASETKQSHYKVLPNISISADIRGCLIIKALNVSSEVVNTNDIVELISESEFKWLGRYDSVINSGGIKLIPEQIEEKLSSIISERFFVAGFKDSVLGEKLVLIIEKLVTEKSKSSISNNNLSENIISIPLNHQKEYEEKVRNLKSLLKFEKPKEIYFIAKFIETPTKKINRQKTIRLLNLN
ncbi:AMP-binding protein [Lutibacter citreus]|uniref:AMP-binding protein n=1 Tax=Lutibacter citreus TaxID=2138210 RepID=UPI000DBE7F5E|nr:AMP-binding protein [Lutibacter citreus]